MTHSPVSFGSYANHHHSTFLSRFIIIIFTLSTSSPSFFTTSFQVTPDPKKQFKNVVKKVVKKKNSNSKTMKKLNVSLSLPPPLTLSDDLTYSPYALHNRRKKLLPLIFSKISDKQSKTDPSSYPSLNRDHKVTNHHRHHNYDKTQTQNCRNEEIIIPLSDQLRFDKSSRNNIQKISALPLFLSGVTDRFIPPHKDVTLRKQFGYDEYPSEYWFDNNIHTLGNTGMLGYLHAAVAPLATKLIDNSAYDGDDVRSMVAKDLRKKVNCRSNLRILDLCCGVGMSTQALANAFKDAETVVGMDTSPEMISVAKFYRKYKGIQELMTSFNISSHFPSSFIDEFIPSLIQFFQEGTTPSLESKTCRYLLGNAERVKAPARSFDLITIMYAFHEIPKSARYRILREARRLLKDGGVVTIIDISTDYIPSPAMLSGEPYVLEYQANIMNQLAAVQGFSGLESDVIVDGHVHRWQLTRNRIEG